MLALPVTDLPGQEHCSSWRGVMLVRDQTECKKSVVSSHQGCLLNFCCFEVSAMPQEALNSQFQQMRGCNSKTAAEASRNVCSGFPQQAEAAHNKLNV